MAGSWLEAVSVVLPMIRMIRNNVQNFETEP